MKKIFIFLTIILLVSCERALVQLDNYLNTRIVLQGDYVQLETSPLTKETSSDKYYAFEVDYVSIETLYYKGYSRSDTTYTHYASGLFTDTKRINIVLKKNQKYRIRCSIIEASTDRLYVEDNYVYEPFVDSKIEKAKITNEFVYGDEKVVCAYVNGNEINVESKGVTSTNARVNRYYAEKIFDISDNTNISLDMTRYNFGLHLYLMPPTEGTLTVRGGSLFEYVLDSNSPLVDESFVYALAINGKKEDVYILVNWEKNDGEVVDLSLGRTTFNNKTMTTINVNINDRIDGSNININYDSEMNYDDIVIK